MPRMQRGSSGQEGARDGSGLQTMPLSLKQAKLEGESKAGALGMAGHCSWRLKASQVMPPKLVLHK